MIQVVRRSECLLHNSVIIFCVLLVARQAVPSQLPYDPLPSDANPSSEVSNQFRVSRNLTWQDVQSRLTRPNIAWALRCATVPGVR